MLEMQRNAQVLRRWWYLLLGATILGGIVAYGLTKVLVKQQYLATAIVSMAPAPVSPSGQYVTMLAASADSQLVPTLATAQAATRYVHGIDPARLESAITSAASPENQLLFIHVQWTSAALATVLTNAVADSFIDQERNRLATRYALVHSSLADQETHLQNLTRSVSGSGTAQTWLRSQYAATIVQLYQQDAAARIEATSQETSLQIAQPASDVKPVGPKPALNAAIGAVLALLIALVIAFLATDTYAAEESTALHPVLTKVGD